jgi:putative transcriptional regulator
MLVETPLSRRSVVPSKAKPLTGAELEAYEAQRDLAAELLQSVREMKAGETEVVLSLAVEARRRTGLSQSQFAALLGVSVRTLQGWEQGRKQPRARRARFSRSLAQTRRHPWRSPASSAPFAISSRESEQAT